MPTNVCVALISDDTDAERDGGASVNGEGTCQTWACERTLVGGRESRTSLHSRLTCDNTYCWHVNAT